MYYVIIDEQYYPVRDEGLDAVRTDVLNAVHGGGAFMSFKDDARQSTEVLVTGCTPIRIRRIEQPENDVAAVTTAVAIRDPPVTDADWWLEWI